MSVAPNGNFKKFESRFTDDVKDAAPVRAA